LNEIPLSDLLGRHFSFPVEESLFSLKGGGHFESFTVIYTATVLDEIAGDRWWVDHGFGRWPSHTYRSGAVIRPWVEAYESLNPIT